MMNTKKITVATPETQPVSHPDVLRAIRSCCLSTSKLARLQVEQRGHSQETNEQTRRYNALFNLLFKRLPTPAELYYMVGGIVPTCAKCNKEIPPNTNGTASKVCSCEKEDL